MLWDLDQSLFTHINSIWTNPFFDAFFPLITDLHKTLYFKIFVLPVLLVLFYWRFHRKGLLIVLFLVLALGSADFLSNKALKKTIQRPRPPLHTELSVVVRSPFGGGYSMPSNHAVNMFTLATYTSGFIPILGFFVFPMAILVAYSRVYNGVHFPSDILVGALIGILFGILFSKLCKKALEKWGHKLQKKSLPQREPL